MWIFKNTILILATAAIFHSCSSKKEENKETEPANPSETIIGEWEAKWEISGEEIREYPDYRKKMEGKMVFRDDGDVTITSYGFDDCLIKSDTSIDVMRWKIDDGTLRIIDKKDINGIPYTIRTFDRNLIKLSLMEDIRLTLTR